MRHQAIQRQCQQLTHVPVRSNYSQWNTSIWRTCWTDNPSADRYGQTFAILGVGPSTVGEVTYGEMVKDFDGATAKLICAAIMHDSPSDVTPAQLIELESYMRTFMDDVERACGK